MKKIFIYLLLVICLSYVAREFIYVGLRKSSSGEFGKLNTLFIKQNFYDVLIIGSSRAESHFVPSVVDSVTGLDCFNAGQSGAMQELNLTILRSYLVHSTAPKILVLNIDIHLPNKGSDTIHHFPKYFPYLGNNVLYEHLKKRDPRFSWFKWISFYSLPYINDYYLAASLRGWMDGKAEEDKEYTKGFIPEQKRVEDPDKDSYPPIDYTIDSEVCRNVSEIISVCKQNNIWPVLVVSPLYYRVSESITDKVASISLLKKLANEHDIPFLDYTTDEMCYKKEYFVNPRHLNKTGAHIFSQKFAGHLLQYLR